jgi:hypothetical protein
VIGHADGRTEPTSSTGGKAHFPSMHCACCCRHALRGMADPGDYPKAVALAALEDLVYL